MDIQRRAEKAEWIHDNYVNAWQKQNIPLGGKLTETQSKILKKEFEEIDRNADKIFGK